MAAIFLSSRCMHVSRLPVLCSWHVPVLVGWLWMFTICIPVSRLHWGLLQCKSSAMPTVRFLLQTVHCPQEGWRIADFFSHHPESMHMVRRM